MFIQVRVPNGSFEITRDGVFYVSDLAAVPNFRISLNKAVDVFGSVKRAAETILEVECPSSRLCASCPCRHDSDVCCAAKRTK